MSRVLLLYDTKERDLARDLNDLLSELKIEVTMIPAAPDMGKSLQDKESHYFNDVDGAIFLVTPGAVREETAMPSPSVADEMGQAKQKFEKTPARIIYLVDDRCVIQAVDQKAYISFRRDDTRSILDAITRLIRNLKQAGLLGPDKLERREAPSVDIADVASKTTKLLKDICEVLSHAPNGGLGIQQFREILKRQFHLSEQDINFAQRDLQIQGLVVFHTTPGVSAFSFFMLTPIGWELVRFEKNQSVEKSEIMKALLQVVPRSKGLFQ
jgi:hypothetical protein